MPFDAGWSPEYTTSTSEMTGTGPGVPDLLVGGVAIVTFAGRQALSLGGGVGGAVEWAIPSLTELTFGMRLLGTVASTTQTLAQLKTSGGTVLSDLQWVASTGLVQLRRGSTVIGSTTSAIAGHYLIVKIRLHDTTGSFELLVDGIVEDSGSGIDTLNGSGTIDRFRLAWQTGGPDRLHVCDFQFVEGLVAMQPVTTSYEPVAADELPMDFVATLTGGDTAHFEALDEDPPDAADYIESTAIGDKATFSFAPTATPGPYARVIPLIVAEKPNSGAVMCKLNVIVGSTTDAGAAQAVGDQVLRTVCDSHPVNPDTGLAWDTAGLDAMHVQIEAA